MDEGKKSVTDIIESVCEDICDNYCRYVDTVDEEGECDITRDGGECPLECLF